MKIWIVTAAVHEYEKTGSDTIEVCAVRATERSDAEQLAERAIRDNGGYDQEDFGVVIEDEIEISEFLELWLGQEDPYAQS